MSLQSIPTINCGVSSMPVVGLGTFKSGANEVGNAIETALRCGYRHIDCALVSVYQRINYLIILVIEILFPIMI